jgi:hypothetical protein
VLRREHTARRDGSTEDLLEHIPVLDPRRLEQDDRALVASELADGTAAYKHVSAQERAQAILEVLECDRRRGRAARRRS